MWSGSVAKSRVQIPGMHELLTYKNALIRASFLNINKLIIIFMLWLMTKKYPILKYCLHVLEVFL